MQKDQSRLELYRAFNELVRLETGRERSMFNRRMMKVLLWCFLAPSALSFLILLLTERGLLPRGVRVYAGWVSLVVPIAYSAYFLFAEVLKDAPQLLRKGGGMGLSLNQFIRDCEWRESFCQTLRRELPAGRDDWAWVIANFRIDLESVRARTRYLTGLAGAVFFLIMQGIDSISGTDPMAPETGSEWDLPQFVGLGLFLLLLYLSGNQTYQTLLRYLGCAEIVAMDEDRA